MKSSAAIATAMLLMTTILVVIAMMLPAGAEAKHDQAPWAWAIRTTDLPAFENAHGYPRDACRVTQQTKSRNTVECRTKHTIERQSQRILTHVNGMPVVEVRNETIMVPQ